MNKLLQAIDGIESRKNAPYNAMNDKEVLKCLNEYYEETKQALQNNVSEEWTIDYTDKDVDSKFVWVDGIDLNKKAILNLFQYWLESGKPNLPLQQPTLEELKQSIIDRLNELWVLIKWNYREDSFILEDKRHMYASIRYNKFKEHSITYDFRFHKTVIKLPIDLAHDITTYFKRLRDSE